MIDMICIDPSNYTRRSYVYTHTHIYWENPLYQLLFAFVLFQLGPNSIL
jgi:hypothetical protein